MKKHHALLLTLVLLVTTAFGSFAVEPMESDGPQYVFYFIGDGLGASQRQISEYFLQEMSADPTTKLLINDLDVAGINTTFSTDTLVTDSAAAGTALATGEKTNNGMISVGPITHESLKTLTEAAMEKGMATGIVTTTRLTHATPAVFAAHNVTRNDENGIASEMAESGVDYFAGGGYRHFIAADNGVYSSKRTDDTNPLMDMARDGYKLFLGESSSERFRNYEPEAGQKVFAAFTASHLPYELDRMQDNATPSLAELTEKGIDLLSKDEEGFFMMIEAGRIDHACHANDAAGAIWDTLALDAAVKEAYDFYLAHPDETLIVVAGDHETGGMGLGFANNYFLNMTDLTEVQVSVEDVLNGVYDGDRAAYFTYITEKLGLDDLAEKERARIERAMDVQDSGEAFETTVYGPGYYSPVAIATTHILSERTNIEWTTFAHSGTAIPLSAEGVGAERFGGFKDNTEIGRTMAEVLGLQIGR